MEENKITWDTVCEKAEKAVEYFSCLAQPFSHNNKDEIDYAQYELGSALCMLMGTGECEPTYYNLYEVIRYRTPHNLTTLKLAVSLLLDDNGKYLMSNVPLPSQIKAYKDYEEFLTKNI